MLTPAPDGRARPAVSRDAVALPPVAQLLADLQALLGPQGVAPDGQTEPVRSVLFGRQRFEQHGETLAAAHEVVPGDRAGDFFPRVASNVALLQRVRGVLERHALEGRHSGPAAMWLLDNAAVLEEQQQLIRQGLSPSFFSRLPRLRHAPLAGLPRVYGVVWAWVAHTDSGLDQDLLTAYLSAYQEVRPLTLAELWSLPTTLRVVLLENLRRLAERSALLELARDAAHHWIDQDDTLRRGADLDLLLAQLSPRGVGEAFLLQLHQRLDELPAAAAHSTAAWLQLHLPAPEATLAAEHHLATQDHQSIRNALTTLRQIDRLDWRAVVQGSSPTLQALLRSPVFSAEREDTQDRTLHAVEKLARRSGLAENAVAEALVQLCAVHPDPQAPAAAPWYWWRGPGRPALWRALGLAGRLGTGGNGGRVRTDAAAEAPAWRTVVYLGVLALLVVGAVAWLLTYPVRPDAPLWLLALTGLLLLGPVGEAVVAVVNRLISESAPPDHLPRLALAQGIPADERVLVVVPCMLSSTAGIDALCAQLAQHAKASPLAHVQFALLSDGVDAPEPHAPGDLSLLAHAQAAVQALNQRHGQGAAPGAGDALPRFLLLHRERQFSASEQCWMGWERKRGKLEQLVRWLADAPHGQPAAQAPGTAEPPGPHASPFVASPFVDMGPLSQPHPQTRHLLTLDADTDLPPGQLLALMGVALHPLNRPRVDLQQRRVVRGYGILQPRVVTPLPLPEAVTWYHQLFAGECGIDPYSAASSEVYQDLFGEGSFSGKGLLNVAALHATLADRLPENQVLSHDLLEGALARCAVVSDVTLVEDAPVHADVAASRVHRWTRGDWQLLPFLLRPARWPMAAINRWKLLDNLRRSLVAPQALGLLLLVLATGVLPLGWTLAVVLAAFCAGPLLGALAGLAPSRDDIDRPLFFRQAGAGVLRVAGLAAWHLAQLSTLAWQAGDAVLRALWRQAVSRRGLLQWTTAAAAQAAARTDLPGLWRQHRRAVLFALALGLGALALALRGQLALPGATAALLALWLASPVWTWLVSTPRPVPRRERLDEADREWLHHLAQDTWQFYAQHVTAQDLHLPPDNVQQHPHEMVAHRTSPTNIGLYLLSAVCAQALGFIGRVALARRLSDTLATLERLPRWRGHFYNWYDTQTGAVLPPAYISTVDSGNCSAHLLAVAGACEQLAQRQAEAQRAGQLVRQSQRRLRALQPVLASAPSLRHVAELVAWDWPAQGPLSPEQRSALETLLERARIQLDALRMGLVLAPAAAAAPGPGAVDSAAPPADRPEMDRLLQDHVALLSTLLHDEVVDAATPTTPTVWRDLAARCRALALAPDFAALYDPQRRLLHIGYRAQAQQLDDNHYDLLASEARLTSLVAIGKGDLPPQHWAALGRPFFACGHEIGLKSWSGSMFEYLMPSLVLDEPVGSVLHQATRSAVAAQIAEAQARGTPWGISESAIAGQDHTLAYQYGPQGVASLALRRTPVDERVIAPYATAMALVLAPRAGLANLRALQALGARSQHGFIEAVDYTPHRQVGGQGFTLVHTHMAHHQGMALLALADLLLDSAPRRWAASEPVLRAITPLLHERAPREVPALRAVPPAPEPRRPRGERLVVDEAPLGAALPTSQLLGNGRQAVLLRSHGAGQSFWQGLAITRARDDLPAEAGGQLMFIRRGGQGPWHSLTARPAADLQARYRCRHLADRSVFEAEWPDLLVRTTVWVSPEDDCELREVVLLPRQADAQAPLDIELASYAELVLAPQRADEAHPAFANLFVRASWDSHDQALYFQRQPRLPDEQPVLAAHFLSCADTQPLQVQPVADRQRVLGRHGHPGRWLGEGGQQWLDDAARLAAGASTPAPSAVASWSDPEASDTPSVATRPLPGRALDTGLDPVAQLRVRLQVQPGQERRLSFCTAVSRQADALEALVDRYRQPRHAERSSGMSATMAGIRLHELQLDADTWAAWLHLNTLVTAQATRSPVPVARPGSGPAPLRVNRRLLWRHGLSGERAMVLVSVTGEAGLPLVHALKKAMRLWAHAGQAVDLVVLNAEPASYLAPVHHQLVALREQWQQQRGAATGQPRGELAVLSAAALSADERHTLHTLARVRLVADGRPLAQQLQRELDEHRADLRARQAQRPLPVAPVTPVASVAPAQPGAEAGPVGPPTLRFDGPMNDAVFELSPAQLPARPWVNVLANPDFGCLVSEMGSGFTWSGNSRLHQLTGWSNDALCDPPAEQLLLHDVDSGEVWPLGRWLAADAPRQVRHALGATTLVQRVGGVEVGLTWCVDPQAPVKQLLATLRLAVPDTVGEPGGAGPASPAGMRRPARPPRPTLRHLRLVATADWQLGAQRSDRQAIASRVQRWSAQPPAAGLPASVQATALLATQLDSPDHPAGAGTAFLSLRVDGRASRPSGADPDDWTCDRRELFDQAGHPVLPQRLGQRQGTGLDACAALGVRLQLAPGEDLQVTVLLGHAADVPSAQALLAEAWAQAPEARLAAQRAQWPQRLGTVQVHTPDAAFDALVNHWLPYQALVCRLWARAGFYQAGGAFGFRDQLQDAMSLVSRDPALLADQIRLHVTRQFAQGDVQHWWHAPGGAGVRTHFSDDLLWLPLACSLYLERTGDARLLDEPLPFLEGASVPAGQEDVYETPRPSAETATVYEHAARAIDHSLRVGRHGLPLMGTGDWNDGMNRVGHGGQGESVWLGWFLCQVVDGLLPVARARGDQARVTAWSQARAGWVQALDAAGWDGQWYRRGFFDDGSPLGSAANPECRIDLIAQAWAVLSGAGRPDRARQAMASAETHLLDRDAGVLRLLDPPLQHARPVAGYIQAYPPGVRENGGQYNHAAAWAVMAWAQLGQAQPAWEAFCMMSPAHRWGLGSGGNTPPAARPHGAPGTALATASDGPELADATARGPRYALEPYVMAGDTYTQPPYTGRGGWSWYTGSAGWLVRAAQESLLGVTALHQGLQIQPCLPPHWPQAQVQLRQPDGRVLTVLVCGQDAAWQAACQAHPQAPVARAGTLLPWAQLSGVSLLLVPPVAAAHQGTSEAASQGATQRATRGADHGADHGAAPQAAGGAAPAATPGSGHLAVHAAPTRG